MKKRRNKEMGEKVGINLKEREKMKKKRGKKRK